MTDESYKVSGDRVDISNGVVFFNTKTELHCHLKNFDRFIMIVVVKKGTVTITDTLANKKFITQDSHSDIYTSSRQDFTIDACGEVFILFIADFFLKRYISKKENEPIDFLYNKVQSESSLELINSQPLDALSLYIINKITKQNLGMNSIKCEHNVIELLIHRFSLLDMCDKSISDEMRDIANKAKEILLSDYVSPPKIELLAHLCATNESKLKKIFKQVYKTTIYGYVQKLRLEKANLLLKDKLLNVGEIAKLVGYKHQGHFSTLFFDTYGVYPKDLLKK